MASISGFHMAFGFACALASMSGVNIVSMFDFKVTSIFGFYMAIYFMCVANSASMFACSVASMSGVHVASKFGFQVASKSVASMWPLCSRAA